MQNKVTCDQIIYITNEKEMTAAIFSLEHRFQVIDELIIPRSIMYNSKEYNVTRILKGSFTNSNIKSLKFSPDAQIQKIDQGAFYISQIESLTIPSHLTELPEGWCDHLKVSKISVSEENPRYRCCFENQMMVGKSSIDQEDFDCLIYCVRDIQKVIIPNYIKRICQYSISECYKLEQIEFQDDSKLQEIENMTFNSLNIKSITIPSQVTRIGRFAFANCRNLEQVKFQQDSKLQIIEKHAFARTAIKSFTIPSKLTKIEESAFECCKHLKIIIIPSDSKLQIIKSNAFYESSIERISIPSQLIEFENGWCKKTCKLKKISVSEENQRYRCCFNNQMIIGKSSIDQENFDCLVFCVRDIKKVIIPSFIKYICPFSLNYCSNLKRIELGDNSKLQTIGESSFCFSSIRNLIIPSEVTKIENTAFSCCYFLQKIEIQKDSKLQIIGESAFNYSKIKSLFIPSKVTVIKNYAFFHCKQLQKIEIQEDSELQLIEEGVFSHSSITCFIIPPKLKKFKNAFKECKNLLIIEVDGNYQLDYIDISNFNGCKNVITMIPSNLRKR